MSLVTDIVGSLARVRAAFDKPTLRLLGKKWAPVVLAVFVSSFSRDQDSIPAERFHVQVETLIADLRSTGADVPDEPARALCRRWVNEQWLVLSANEENVEEYALTSHAQEAIDYVNRLSGDRSMFSESRIRTIVEAARRCAMDANPDREQRLRRLDEQIARLTAERDRIAEGAAVQAASDDRVLEEYLNLRDLIALLPADFMRVSESVKAIHRGIIGDFREEGRRTGVVLDEYLRRSSDLMAESQEGRAFTGAVELLRDDQLLSELRDDLATILDHPFAVALTPAEEREFRDTVRGIRHGIDVVLDQRRRLSSTLRAHITRHDALRDKELDEALRRAKSELARWMVVSGPRARVTVELGLSSVHVGHARQRFYNPADHVPPTSLVDTSDEVGDTVSVEDLRMQGGPRLAALRRFLRDAVGRAGSTTAGSVFGESSDDLRRPVEVLGLVQIAASVEAFDYSASATEVFEAVRPDGSRRRFRAPLMTFRDEHRAELDPDWVEGGGNEHLGAG